MLRWPVLLPLLIAVALTTAYHLLARPFGPGILLGLDDGYIHSAIARTFAEHGTFGIHPDSSSGGSSSLLWTSALALLTLFGLGSDLAALLLGMVSFPLTLFCFHRLATSFLPDRSAFYASLLLAFSGMQAALALTGMEAQLASGLLLGGFAALTRKRPRSATIWFSLAILTRFEMGLAIAALVAVKLWPLFSRQRYKKPKPESSIPWSYLALMSGIALAGLLLLTWLSDSFPSTFAARRWLYGLGEKPFTTLGPMLPQVGLFFSQVGERFAKMIGPGGILGWFWALIAFEFILAGMVILWRRDGIARAFLIYLLLQFIFVLFGLGSEGHLGRYLEPLWVSLPLFVLLGWDNAFSFLHGSIRRPLAYLTIALMLIGFLPQAARWAQWHTGSIYHLSQVHGVMADLVHEEICPGEPIAAFDIGLLAWRTDHQIIDIGGLGSREMVRRMYRGTVPAYLAEAGVHWVVLPHPRSPRLHYILALRLGFDPATLHPVDSVWLPDGRTGHLKATRVAMPALTLYRLRQ